MIRQLILTLALAAGLPAANAQSGQMLLGYCDGTYNETATDALSVSGKDTDVSAAIEIPAATAAIYAGNTVTHINAALCSTLNIDRLQVWLRTSLDEEPLVIKTITKDSQPALSKGWNTITLDTPYTLAATDAPLYIGLTYHQKGTAVGLSVLPPTTSIPTPGTLYYRAGDDAPWEDRSAEGILAIEAVVEGDALPQHNIALRAMTMPSVVSAADGRIAGTVTVRNLGMATLTAFDLRATVDDDNTPYTCAVSDIALATGDAGTYDVTLVIPTLTTDNLEHTLHLSLANPCGAEDADMTDNTAQATFGVVSKFYPRRVLV